VTDPCSGEKNPKAIATHVAVLARTTAIVVPVVPPGMRHASLGDVTVFLIFTAAAKITR